MATSTNRPFGFCAIRAPWPGIEEMIELKIRTDMPLPTPRSVTSSPSHMMTAVPAVSVTTRVRIRNSESSGMIACGAVREQPPRARQRDDAGGLQHGERDGQVARVLRQLGLTGLPLLLERLQPRDHHDEQLHDDRRRDVRHDPEREDAQLEQRATAEQVDQAVEALALDLLEAALDRDVADARTGDDRAEPVEADDREREEQLAAQVGRLEGPTEGGEHGSSWHPPRGTGSTGGAAPEEAAAPGGPARVRGAGRPRGGWGGSCGLRAVRVRPRCGVVRRQAAAASGRTVTAGRRAGRGPERRPGAGRRRGPPVAAEAGPAAQGAVRHRRWSCGGCYSAVAVPPAAVIFSRPRPRSRAQ